ncbi:unnamed protein product [Echinostoma caproni]|uniref:RPN13_C domain-containing protein n=1 Tax=Echinostoma caproni TaxID=27848 RepID=A0A183B3T9_9TREM|nr:unnamed protein product [Echinostoma caproni]
MSSLFRDTFGATAESAAPDAPPPAAPQPDANGTQPPTGGSSGNMDQFMRVCQQLGQQLRDSNPQLIEQLRQSFTNNPNTQNFQFPDGDGATPK